MPTISDIIAVAIRHTSVTPLVVNEPTVETRHSLEWWLSDRKVTVYIMETGDLEWLMAWGPDMEREMLSGITWHPDSLTALFQWLAQAQ